LFSNKYIAWFGNTNLRTLLQITAQQILL